MDEIDGKNLGEQGRHSGIEACCLEVDAALREHEDLVNLASSDDPGTIEAWNQSDARVKQAVIALVAKPASSLSELSRKLDAYGAWTETVELEDDLAARLSGKLVFECREMLRSHLKSEVSNGQMPFVSPSTSSRMSFPFTDLFAGSRRTGSRRSEA